MGRRRRWERAHRVSNSTGVRGTFTDRSLVMGIWVTTSIDRDQVMAKLIGVSSLRLNSPDLRSDPVVVLVDVMPSEMAVSAT